MKLLKSLTVDMITNIIIVFRETVKVLCGTIFLALLAANFLFSLCQLAIIKIVYRLWYSQPFNILWGMDAFLQYQDIATFAPPQTQTMSYFVIRFKGIPNVSEIQRRLNDKLFACFKKKIVTKFGYYVWEENPNFCIEDHVRLHPQKYDSDKSLIKLLTLQTQQPYPNNHSPWEIVLIRNQKTNNNLIQQDEDEYVFTMRCHHSLCDGATVLSIIASLCDDSTTHRLKEQLKVYTEHPEKMSPVLRCNALMHYLATRKQGSKLTPSIIFAIALNVFQVLQAIPHLLMNCLHQKERNSVHGPQLCGRKILGLSELIDIKMFRDIAVARNCTINDVLVCCAAGAFRKEDEFTPTIGAYFVVRGMSLGNFGIQNSILFAKTYLPLTHQNANERLPHIVKVMNEFKSSPASLAALIIVYLTGNHIPKFVGKICLTLFDGTVVFTNVIGPDYAMTLCGNLGMHEFYNNVFHLTFSAEICWKEECISTYLASHKTVILCPINGAISLSCLSCIGRVRLGAVIDRAVAPDDAIADRLLNNIVEELKDLHKSVVEQRPDCL